VSAIKEQEGAERRRLGKRRATAEQRGVSMIYI